MHGIVGVHRPHQVHSAAGFRPTVRVGLLGAVRTLVLLARRARCGDVLRGGVLPRSLASSFIGLREGVRHTAQLFGSEVQGLHIRTRFPQGPQHHHVERRAGFALGFRAVGVLVGEQELGHRRLLVCDDVVPPAPHDGGALLPYGRAGEDGPVVAQRDAGYLPLPLPWPGGRGAAGAGAPGSTGGSRSGSATAVGGCRGDTRSDSAHRAETEQHGRWRSQPYAELKHADGGGQFQMACRWHSSSRYGQNVTAAEAAGLVRAYVDAALAAPESQPSLDAAADTR